MKHSKLLKAIAIILCAASLMTFIGSIGGIVLMTEMDLYDHSVDEVIEQTYESQARSYAQAMALRYASTRLGGCPEVLAYNQFWDNGFYSRFISGGLGYSILDEEGTLIAALHQEVKDTAAHFYSFPVEGNYLHLVSLKPRQVEVSTPDRLEEGEYGTIDNLTEDFTPVYFIQISYDGGSEGIGSQGPLGFLTRDPDGTVQFFQADNQLSFGLDVTDEITHITFLDMSENVLYEIADSSPVAAITHSEGQQIISLIDYNADTAAPGETPVYEAIFYGADGQTVIEHLRGTQPIGSASLNEQGHLNFQLYVNSFALQESGVVFALVLMDQDGAILFGEASPQLRAGAQVGTTDGLTFSSHPDALAVAMPAPAEESAPAGEETRADESSAVTEDATGATESGDTAQTTASQQEANGETVPPTAPAETTPPTTVPETVPPTTVPETIPETTAATEPMMINGKSVKEYDLDSYGYYDPETDTAMQAYVVHLPMPAYTVEVYIAPGTDTNEAIYVLLDILWQLRSLLIPVLLASLALLVLCTVYLCISAGHGAADAGLCAGGLNRMPLDLYFVLGGSGITGLYALIVAVYQIVLMQAPPTAYLLILLPVYLMCLIVVGFCFALVAQCKTPGGYLWTNSVLGRAGRACIRAIRWLSGWTAKTFLPWLWKTLNTLWVFTLKALKKGFALLCLCGNVTARSAKSFFRRIFDLVNRFVALLPLTWQWVLGGMLLLFLGVLAWANRNDGWGMVWLMVGLAMILYIAHCFGLLYEGAIRMNKGDLETKIDDKRMMGCFRNFAIDLNNLADVVVAAAQKQLRSERMKTELITNVSHDIKTPLTSIINYVDLLQKPHTEEEEAAYLEVLERQSLRLKKLIDDLMEMSKANTGNMSVEITRVDAVEAVNQALGEFADKLTQAELIPIFRHNVDEAMILADGRLLWRVLSNLLGNAVKYAMPGTRLYVDLMKLDKRVVISLKNISRDVLMVNADELMERFVRGDDSRNTEGSGLGLNIARSLMELQKGHLQLLIDGDLFKASLVFPIAEE